jgi:hypothetical protein
MSLGLATGAIAFDDSAITSFAIQRLNPLMSIFKGVFTALITPFKDGKIDDEAYQALIERQIENGVSGIIPVGTTGESATVDDTEHWHLFDLARKWGPMVLLLSLPITISQAKLA